MLNPKVQISPDTCILFSDFPIVAIPGESNSEIAARLKRDLVPTAINGLMYWPICDFITFKFVPVHLQVCSRTLRPIDEIFTTWDHQSDILFTPYIRGLWIIPFNNFMLNTLSICGVI